MLIDSKNLAEFLKSVGPDTELRFCLRDNGLMVRLTDWSIDAGRSVERFTTAWIMEDSRLDVVAEMLEESRAMLAKRKPAAEATT